MGRRKVAHAESEGEPGRRRAAAGERKPALFDDQMREGHGSPYIRIGARGRLETNLSGEQLRTVLRLAKLELEDLREILQPHKTKVIGELLDIVSLDERKKE